MRNCVLDGWGTGVYLGNSNGQSPTTRVVFANNVVTNTIGYCMQIKHNFDLPAGLETGNNIIERNIFHKSALRSSLTQARPNLLVGAFPPSVDSFHIIRHNVFVGNPTGEALFQGEGQIDFHHNILLRSAGNGRVVSIQNHNIKVRSVRIAHNLARGGEISVAGGSDDQGEVRSVQGNVASVRCVSCTENTYNVDDGDVQWSIDGSILSLTVGGVSPSVPKLESGVFPDSQHFVDFFGEQQLNANTPGAFHKPRAQPLQLDLTKPLPGSGTAQTKPPKSKIPSTPSEADTESIVIGSTAALTEPVTGSATHQNQSSSTALPQPSGAAAAIQNYVAIYCLALSSALSM